MLPKEVIDLMNQTSRKLSQYEYEDSEWEFLCDPAKFIAEENLSEEEVEGVWDDIAQSLQSTPAWCLEARVMHTLSVGDSAASFLALTRRLSGRHKEKLDACFLSRCSMADLEKYSPLSRLDHS